MIRKLFFVTGCFFIFGIFSTRAQAPVPDFSASTTAGCGPLGVQFKDLSANAPLYWQWDFGNGQTSALQNPSVNYTTPGTYTVTLIARNRSGADAIRKTDYITVYPYPVPKFTSNLTLACAPANVQFADQSTAGQGSVTSWAWDLGDGTSSNQQSPSHSYTQNGYYNISLKVTNSGGCSNTTTQVRYIRVVDGVQPNFTWDQTSATCTAPFLLNFVNQTAAPGDLTYSWNFGSGATPASSSDASPSNITYPATGNYDVTLQVFSSLGCSGSLKQTVPLNNNAAAITSPDQACANVPLTFTDGSTPPPLSIAWDFGDGTNSTDLNPSKTYTANGTYTVKLTNTYGACTSTATKTIQIADPPTPVFTADKTFNCQAPLTVQFQDQSPPGASKWLWDFGDGQTSTAQNPAHTYTIVGNFTVKLTTTTAGGCSATTSINNYINVVTPTINFDNNSLHGCVSPAIMSPVALPNTVDGVSAWAWTVSAATPSSSTSPNPSFSFPAQGNFAATLTITTAGGCTATQKFTIQVGTPTPANITVSAGPYCGRDRVTFSDPVTPGTENEYQWLWNLGVGDNVLTNQPSIDYSYFDVGPKHITLTLIHNGCPRTATPVDISIHPPIVLFKYQPDCGAVNNFPVLFTDTSYLYTPFNQYTATWDFGDGTTQTGTTAPGATVTHIYTPSDPTVPSSYSVTLTTSDGTCTQTLTKTIVVGPTPFTFTSPSQQCSGSPIHLTATSTRADLITGYYWHWDTDPDQTYVFSASPAADMINTARGIRKLTLVVQLANGCFDSLSHDVLITYPDALFTFPAGSCKNSTVQFTDQSSADPATNSPLQKWSWNFGDGTTPSTAQNATHTYTDTGLFTPQLFIQDANFCSRTYISPTPIHITSPIANFDGPDSFYCPKTPLIFKDASIGFNLTDSWNYGDGNTDNTGTHSYANNQTYNVTLTVTDQFTCTNSITKPVRIQSPIPAFDMSDTTAICVPLQTKFIAHGQYYDSLYWDFGDGSTSTLPVTSHFYNSTGIFNATLFLQGPGGCLESTTRQVFLLDPVAASKFNYGPLRMCDSVPVQFDLAPPGFTSFTLVFGDGAADSSRNLTPFHMYRNPGSYTPTLVLVDPTGCIVNVGTAIGPITVLGSVPFVSLDPHAFCDSSIVTFTDYTITNDGIVSETLNFGDGTPPETHNTGVADFNTDHFYNKPGTFLATLHVVTNTSCAETYTDTVRVHQTPHPLISVISPLCAGTIEFNGNTTVPQTEPVSWAWDFGNGQTAKDQNPTAGFKPGNYIVKLQTAVPFGCSDTTSQPITINPLPEIKGPREISTPVGIPITIPFTYSDNVTTWAWIPKENLDCSTCANPVATLVFKHEYEVTVTDLNNCSASDSILIITICNDKNYFIPNTFSPNGDGVNDYFYPRGSNLYNIQSLQVFNRWGQVVFERKNFPANDATLGWDGKINGRPAPVDAYVYIAEVVCNNAQVVALHGDVTLIR